MREALCMCCSDITRYKRKVSEVSVKINLLQRILSVQRIDVKEYEEFRRKYRHRLFILQNDSTHFHFMCGECLKADRSELKIKEDQLREVLGKVFFLISKTHDESIYHNTLRLLQGDYPITYNCLVRMWH